LWANSAAGVVVLAARLGKDVRHQANAPFREDADEADLNDQRKR
jgi:hypothetical protein